MGYEKEKLATAGTFNSSGIGISEQIPLLRLGMLFILI